MFLLSRKKKWHEIHVCRYTHNYHQRNIHICMKKLKYTSKIFYIHTCIYVYSFILFHNKKDKNREFKFTDIITFKLQPFFLIKCKGAREIAQNL